MSQSSHACVSPSPWVQHWSHLLPAEASVLDVACGSGRHTRWFAQRGCKVTALDRDEPAVRALQGIAEVVVADIETQPWPLQGRRFAAVIVTNYLWRDLLPTLIDSLAGGGVLIYETFAIGNESVGKPSNPNFLLRPGELLDASKGLRVVAFEDGFLNDPARFVQRLVAVREAVPGSATARYTL